MGDQNSQQRVDQRTRDAIVYQSFNGLRSDVDPERFELGDLAAGNNVDIDKSGRIARRGGYAKEIDGATRSIWASDELGLALCVQGTQLLRINPDFTTKLLATGLTPGQWMSYQRVNDRVYFSNGHERGVVENGIVRSWGLAVPPLPAVVATVGAMPEGIYQYVLTGFRVDGQESGAGLAGKISLPAQSGIRFALPTLGADVAKIGVYLSTPNGDKLLLALTVPNGTATVTYANDTSNLVLPLETQFMGPPPTGHLLAYYRGHMFAAVGDTLYPSEPFNFELFDLRKHLQFDGRITLIAGFEDKELYEKGRKSGLFAGTDRSCGVVVGSSPEDFEYVPKTDYGAVEGALDYVDGSLYGDNSTGAKRLPMWLTTQGICIGTPDLEVKNLTRTRYSFPTGARGAALFQAGPNRFTVVTNL